MFSFVPMVAHGVEGESPETSTTSAEQTTETETDIASRKARIEKRKAEITTKLTLAQKARLKSKCKASQGLTKKVGGRINGIHKSRSAVHNNIISHLTKLSNKLKEKNIDVTELNASIAELNNKINTFDTDLSILKLALADMNKMDCEEDPDGFKASLEVAREALKIVHEDSKAIRQYVKDVIKPLLKDIKKSLNDNESSEESN